MKAPQTDAKLLEAASLLPNQLFLRGKELLGGPEVEESALRKCVELHEKWQRGEKGPVMNKRWQGEDCIHLSGKADTLVCRHPAKCKPALLNSSSSSGYLEKIIVEETMEAQCEGELDRELQSCCWLPEF